MAVFKCKMCGGTIEFNAGDAVGICDSCGTKQTLPKSNDDAVNSLFNRANTLRIKSEFDRAGELYNKIISVDETQAEAYWGLILCKYGIEYVEDPKTFKRVPTCHRTSFESITADEDFKLAVKYADISQKEIYQQEAKDIDEIQKDILKIAADEKPFDVFLCYKETDESGKRTQDSVIANDIYHQLTQEGYKVFYAAITLEDKLGQEYEPYIFAALNSAKVMLVIGSKPEYFTAVWVKNEWSRFLKLMKNDRSKLLIPCYKDMDAYELPDDFAHLQAQDMSKIGFINDVVRGIKKVVNKEKETPKVKETVVVSNTQTNANVVALKKRGFMALEDGEWQKAYGFFEEALNQDAEDAECYLGKLMVELGVGKREDLKNCAQPFDSNPNYVKACKFDRKLEKELNEYNEIVRKNNIYDSADFNYSKLKDFETALKEFESITGWKDADEKAEQCRKNIEELKIKKEKEKIEAEKRAEEKRIADEKRNAKIKKIMKIAIPVVAVLLVLIIIVNSVITNQTKKRLEAIRADLPVGTISAGDSHTVGLKTDGTVVAVGDNFHGRCDVSDWKDIVAVSTGYSHTVGLKSDGTVVATKFIDNPEVDYDDYNGQCDVSDWKDIVAVSAGKYHTVGLKSDGTVVAVGDNYDGQCDVSDWKDIVAVSAGGFYTVGLKSDGTVVAVGDNYEGKCDVSDWKDIVAVSAGKYHTVGLKSDGTVVAVGYNGDGRCDAGDWKDIVAVSAGGYHTVGLKSDGTVVAVGYNEDGRCDISGWKDIIAVSAGEEHTVGLKSDGTVVAVGDNDCGQCNVSDWKNIKTINK